MHHVHTRLVSEPEHVQARTMPDFEHLRGPIGTGDGSEFTSHGFQHVVLPSACLEIMRLRIIVRRNLVVVCRQPSNLRVARSSAMLASILARWPCSCPMQRSRVGRLIGGGSSRQHTDSAACFPPLDDTTETRRSHPSPPPRGLPRVVSDAAKGFQSSIREHLIHPWIHRPEVLYCGHSRNRIIIAISLAAYSEGLRRSSSTSRTIFGQSRFPPLL